MTDPRSDAGSIARRVLVAVGRWAFEHRWFLVLVVAALVLLAAGGLGYLAWQRYQRGDVVWAAFLGALPVLPVIFTVVVLGVTYL